MKNVLSFLWLGTVELPVRAAVRIILANEKWPTQADLLPQAQRYTQAQAGPFSRPMTGHTPQKLPAFAAISYIIAFCAQSSPTRAFL
ncbi:MAG: hypothetical protein ACLTTF_02600 [Oscillospiraceae bacterium]